METNYFDKKFMNFVTMPDDIENNCWEDVCESVRKVAEYAFMLRIELETLSECMSITDAKLVEDDGTVYDEYDVQDMANSVAEVENLFDREEPI